MVGYLESYAVELGSLLVRRNPRFPGPNWLLRNDRDLFRSIWSCAPCADGEVDWKNVVSLLDHKWRKRWTDDVSSLPPKRTIQGLHDLLVRADPTSFGLEWIRDADAPLHGRLEVFVEEGWGDVLFLLGEPWVSRWFVPTEADRIAGLAVELRSLLEKAGPETFGPGWIERSDQPLYRRIRDVLPREGRWIDWSPVIALLDRKWVERWRTGRAPDRGLEGLVWELERLFERRKPDKVNPAWIGKAHSSLYRRILKHFASQGRKVCWDEVTALVDPAWKKCWIPGARPMGELSEIVEELRCALAEKDPKRFDPKWIKERLPPLYRRIRRHFDAEGRKIDWDAMLEILGPEWVSRWEHRYRTGSRLEDLVEELRSSLVERGPLKFGPGWLARELPNLHERMLGHFSRQGRKVSWSEVLEALGPEWSVRWEHRYMTGRGLPDLISDLNVLLREHRPRRFGPKWIRTTDKRLYLQIIRSFSVQGRRVSWKEVVDLVDPSLKRLWDPRGRDGSTLEGLVDELKTQLKRHRPQRFGPKWIEDNDGRLYEKFRHLFFRHDGSISWDDVLKMLGPKWRGIWVTRRDLMSRRTELVDRLRVLLEEGKASVFGPEWIRDKDENLYAAFLRNFKRPGVGVDWGIVRELLGEEWAERWQSRRDVVPSAASTEHENADGSALAAIVETRKRDLYVLVLAQTKKELALRDAICDEVAREVRKGNVTAERWLIEQIMIAQGEDFEIDGRLRAGDYDRHRLEKVVREVLAGYRIGSESLYGRVKARLGSAIARRSADTRWLDDDRGGERNALHELIAAPTQEPSEEEDCEML